MPKEIINQCQAKMDKTIEAVKKEFSTIRTGKANPSVLNGVKVEYYGTLTPISQIASISVQDAKTIIVKPFDRSTVKAIEKIIQSSDLGLNPINDGDLIRIPVPSLTEQTRKDLAKQAKKVAEDNKVAIRNIRRDAVDQLKKLEKDGLISEDELKRNLDKTQKVTDDYIMKIELIGKEKEQDIMAI